jgi:hypothetical protein
LEGRAQKRILSELIFTYENGIYIAGFRNLWPSEGMFWWMVGGGIHCQRVFCFLRRTQEFFAVLLFFSSYFLIKFSLLNNIRSFMAFLESILL